MTVGNGADAAPAISAALRRLPCSLVEVEVRAVLLATAHPGEGGSVAQLVYDRVDRDPRVRTTLAAVHHGARPLPPPATYERVHPGAALLGPSEIETRLPPGRGVRWVAPSDPGGRAWATGVRLVAMVDGAASARALARHFGVPLHLERRTARDGPRGRWELP